MPRVSSVPIHKGEHPIPVYASAMRSAQAPMVPCTRGRRLLPSTASADSLGFLSDPGWAGLLSFAAHGLALPGAPRRTAAAAALRSPRRDQAGGASVVVHGVSLSLILAPARDVS